MKTRAGAGLLLILPLGVHMRYVIRIHFAASNNVAQYEALVNGLKITIELGVRRLDVRGDSHLVIDQVMKASNCHDPKWRHTARRYVGSRTNSTASSSSTSPNATTRQSTNSLRSLRLEARSRPMHSREICTSHPSTWAWVADVEINALQQTDVIKALLAAAEVMEAEQQPGRPFDWRTPFLDCLIRCELPEDRSEARRIARRAKSYVIYGEDNELYRRSPTGIL